MLLLFEKHFVKKILYKDKLSFRYQLIGFYHNRHNEKREAQQVVHTKLNRERTSLLFNFEQNSKFVFIVLGLNKKIAWIRYISKQLKVMVLLYLFIVISVSTNSTIKVIV